MSTQSRGRPRELPLPEMWRAQRPQARPGREPLRRVGVAVRLLTRPAEADEIHDGPALDEVDAADFVRLLEARMGSPPPGWATAPR